MALRSDIRALARVFADQDNAQFPTDAQANTLIDAWGKRVWYQLIGAGWPIHYTTQTFNGAGAPGVYQVNSGNPVMSIVGVYYVLNNIWTPLQVANPGRIAQLRSNVSFPYAQFYRPFVDPTMGAVIELYPPSSTGQYVVEYIPEFPGFSADSTPWYGPARTDELIARGVAADMMRKEGRVPEAGDQMKAYAEVWEEVVRMASWFDQRYSAQIRDVTENMRLPFDYDLWPQG